MRLRRHGWFLVLAIVTILTVAAPAVATHEGDVTLIEVPDAWAGEDSACTGEWVEATGRALIEVTEFVAPNGTSEVTLRYRDWYNNDEYSSVGFAVASFDAVMDIYAFDIHARWVHVDGAPKWESNYSGWLEIEDGSLVGGGFDLVRSRCLTP